MAEALSGATPGPIELIPGLGGIFCLLAYFSSRKAGVVVYAGALIIRTNAGGTSRQAARDFVDAVSAAAGAAAGLAGKAEP